MNTVELFCRIRPKLTALTSSALSDASGLRVSLTVPLERLFILLERAVSTKDPRQLDPVIGEWSTGEFEHGAAQGGIPAATVFAALAQAALTVSHETLTAPEALTLTAAIMPALFYAQQRSVALEYERQVQHVSEELNDLTLRLGRLDRTKSNFISVAGHELRTPLTLIEGYATMLSDLLPEREDQTQTLMAGIHTGVQRLKDIVDDMMDVSLIDSNLLALRCQPLRLRDLFTSLAPEFADIAAERQLKIDIHRFPGSDTLIFADPERLRQAFRNMLTNAVKYTPDGGHITVDGRSLPGFVETVISDTGIGIDIQDQAAIFEKFEQVGQVSLHSTGKTKFKGGGPGLGLAITRGIIQAHGGEIWVESRGYDEVKCPGTTFHILLPHRPPAVDAGLAKLFGQEATATIR